LNMDENKYKFRINQGFFRAPVSSIEFAISIRTFPMFGSYLILSTFSLN
jgi:hypothetical protein